MTTRDDVWDAALQMVRKRGRFQRSELDFDEEQRHTVRRTLREMEGHDWLVRTSRYSPIWRAGPKVQAHLRMSEEALAAAEPDADEPTE